MLSLSSTDVRPEGELDRNERIRRGIVGPMPNDSCDLFYSTEIRNSALRIFNERTGRSIINFCPITDLVEKYGNESPKRNLALLKFNFSHDRMKI